MMAAEIVVKWVDEEDLMVQEVSRVVNVLESERGYFVKCMRCVTKGQIITEKQVKNILLSFVQVGGSEAESGMRSLLLQKRKQINWVPLMWQKHRSVQ